AQPRAVAHTVFERGRGGRLGLAGGDGLRVLLAVAQHAERRHHLGVLLERRARALHGALLRLVDAHAEAEDQILAEPERSTVPSRSLLVVANPALDQLFRRGRDDALDAVAQHEVQAARADAQDRLPGFDALQYGQ